MVKFQNNKQRVNLGLGIFFIMLSLIEFMMHNGVIDLGFGFLFLLAGITRFILFLKNVKVHE